MFLYLAVSLSHRLSPPAPSLFRLPLSALCLSHTHEHTIRFNWQPLTSSRPSRRRFHQQLALPPLWRACNPAHNYSGDWEKPDVDLDAMRSESEGPRHPPQGFVILTGFSINCVRRRKESWSVSQRGQGQAPGLGSLLNLSAMCSATFRRGFSICSEGFYCAARNVM